jgi:uncharacterized protein
MDAVQLLTHGGGWPLNCFTLPDGRPVFGGTYFPKENWKQVLQSLHEVYLKDYEKVLEQAEAITAGISDISPLIQNTNNEPLTPVDLERFYTSLSKSLDTVWGGSKGAPKFPMPVNFEFLLRFYYHTKNQEILDAISLTLDKMALGGIYDHLGGGFARYSTDERWLVPHFEKMLYDNAQLISLYSKAYKLTRNEAYKNVIVQTMDFVERELTSPEGAFYSSLDADSEGEEGKFYVWTKQEIDEILLDRSEKFCSIYQVSPSGNWEHGKNILHLTHFNPPEEESFLEACRQTLLKEREKRARPALDSKILCSWNALMLEACLDAYTALGDEKYYNMALTNATYLERIHIEKGKVWRVNQNLKAIHGFLDDYANIANAFIHLFRISCNEKWLQMAMDITHKAVEEFFDPTTGLFFYTSDKDNPLAVRKHELHDNVTPASNSVIATVLFQLGRYYNHVSFTSKAKEMLNAISGSMLQHTWYHANWAQFACDTAYGSFEVAITGPEAREKSFELESLYLPNILLCGSPAKSILPLLENRYKPGETWIYVCENQTCQMPVNKTEAALETITKEDFSRIL